MAHHNTVPSLPPEITDSIIDHCHADLEVLSTCGMVCKSWYPASRYHLFAAVEISKDQEKDFRELLRMPAITVVPYLQELSLHLRVGDTESWLPSLVSALPEYVPLRTLRIFCHGVELSKKIRHKFTTTFRSITSLSLFESTLLRRSLASDVQFICSFRDLTTILFYGHHRNDMDISSNVELPTHVHTLKLDLPSSANEAFMRWLLSHRRIPTVSTLRIFRITDDSNPALQSYLRACKGELTDLMLFLYQCRTDPAEFDLCQHTSLKNIYLNLNGTSTTRSAHEILSTIQLSDLENIILRISSYELAEVENWVQLDELWTSEAFPKSMEVTIVIDEHGLYEDKMKERLPRCVANGQLSVVCAGTPNIATNYVDEVYSRMKCF